MGRTGKIAAAVLGGLALVVVLLVAAALVIDWGRFGGTVERMVSDVLGREVRIGELKVDKGWTTTITLKDVRVANPPWLEGDLATIGTVLVKVKLLPFLTGDTVLPEVTLRRPEISAVRSKEGRVNWDFAPEAETAADVAKPEERREFPRIDLLVIEDGRMSYRDETRGLALEGEVATVVGEGEGRGGVELALKGSLEKLPVRFSFKGGGLAQLRGSEQPYPFDITLRVGKTEVRAKGSAREPVKMQGLETDFSLRGPSLAHVFPIFGIPMPHTPAYSVKGRLARRDGAWEMRDLSGRIGKSDIHGSLAVEYGPERPFLRANLVSDTINAGDLGGLIGRRSEDEKPKRDGVLPDTRIDRERFKAADLDVRFRGKRLTGPSLPSMALDVRIVLRDGVAHVKPLEVAVAPGAIAGEVVVDTTRDPPMAKAAVALKGLDLAQMFKGTRFAGKMSGKFNGNAKLEGMGWSFAESLGRAKGSLHLSIAKGTFSALLLEAAGLDLAEALAVIITGDAPIGIRCGRIDAGLKDGVLRFDRALLDTTDSLLMLGGSVDLGEESMDLSLTGHAKDFSLIDAAAPIVVRGSFTKPKVRIGGIDLLPFFEVGETRNLDCAALLETTP